MPSDIPHVAGRHAGRFSSPGSRLRQHLDSATTLGLVLGFLLLGSAIVLGGSARSFIDARALLIVLAGTLAVTTISFSLKDIASTQRIVLKTLVRGPRDPSAAAHHVLTLAERARREGVLALRDVLPQLGTVPFLARGLELAADGIPGQDVEQIMRRELEATQERHTRGVALLYRAADVAPAMGLIGTLVGLVQMLGSLEDPATIGPSMSVALLTTFYGAVLANMVLTPLAGKLQKNSADERLLNEIFVLGVTSIGRQENPRRLEIILNTVLPPSKRVNHFS